MAFVGLNKNSGFLSWHFPLGYERMEQFQLPQPYRVARVQSERTFVFRIVLFPRNKGAGKYFIILKKNREVIRAKIGSKFGSAVAEAQIQMTYARLNLFV